MTLDEAIKRYINNAEYERKNGNLQGCLEFRQLAEWLKDYNRLLEQELSDIVSRGVLEQVMRERDIAIEQLHELGYEWGQKIEPCDDAISRQAVLQAVNQGCQEWRGIYGRCEELINALPSVTQKSGKMLICPSCNLDVHSDFKRCPRCGAKMFEPQESEG